MGIHRNRSSFSTEELDMMGKFFAWRDSDGCRRDANQKHTSRVKAHPKSERLAGLALPWVLSVWVKRDTFLVYKLMSLKDRRGLNLQTKQIAHATKKIFLGCVH